MATQTTIPVNLADWALSPHTVAILTKEPEILADLAESRLLPPFPPGYVPQVIEIWFDDIPYIRVEAGTVTYLRDCRPDYEPPFVEYRFDDEIALFQVGRECVVNRIAGIANVVDLTSRLL
jgi:hypothetical protein